MFPKVFPGQCCFFPPFFRHLKFPPRTKEVFSRHSVSVTVVMCHLFLLCPEGAHNSLKLENKSFHASTCISSIDADRREGDERRGLAFLHATRSTGVGVCAVYTYYKYLYKPSVFSGVRSFSKVGRRER